ncbi:MAG: ComF family protein [Bacteroidota bacterium]
MNWPSKIINDINSILLPPMCFGCTAQLSGGEHLLCTVCRHDLPLTDYNFNQENAVDRIFYGRVRIEKAASFLYYSKQGIVKNLLHYLKYKNQQNVGEFIGDWFGAKIANEDSLNVDIVVPVPLHPKRLKKRGYNQVELFGKKLSAHLKAEFRDDILIKTENAKTQTKKNRLARWKNSQDLFVIKHSKGTDDKNLLLVDDVITTGATIEACATALLQIPNAKIYVATMAVVP